MILLNSILTIATKVISLILVAYLFSVYQNLPREIKIFNFYVLANFAIDLLGTIYKYQGYNNLPFLHLYIFLEMIFLLWFLIHCTSITNIKRTLQWVIAMGIILMIVEPAIGSLKRFNNISLIYVKLSLIIFSTISLFNLYRQDRTQKDYPKIYGGIILYASVSVLVFGFGNLLVDIPLIKQYYLWFPHIICFIIFLILSFFDIRKALIPK